MLTHARERRVWGSRDPASPSLFLAELPRELLAVNVASALPRSPLNRGTTITATPNHNSATVGVVQSWKVGDLLLHTAFGTGQVTHIFGTGEKVHLAVKFPNAGHKIVDPKSTALQRVE